MTPNVDELQLNTISIFSVEMAAVKAQVIVAVMEDMEGSLTLYD